ncbi:uncharacterized protein LOC135817073 isoform X2 [Sycon ciliatum]|uniref:uncharacterized protein LOC135817073 isoform X2 n=1 Tax=Sycon ciliatum TaxID=27933 RepID=UPI0020A8D2F3|eukprot:scpid10465/ scgid35003/ Pleckstrin homology domain-containing family G member 5; Guanine nucleotide exchange factor 720
MESGTPGEPSANGLMREDDLLCVGTPSITSDQSFGDTSLETDHDAPICQNFPCPNNNQAALVCYHVECVKLARKSYRFYCMDCDTNQHEDAPYHVRTTVSQYQAALPYYTPSANEDTTSQSSLTIKRDRLGSGKRKKFKIRKSSDSSDPKKGGMTIALPNSTQHPVKLDDSLLRSVVQRMCTQQKIDMEFLEVVYSTNNEHVDLDNHVLAFYGVTLNVNDRAGSPRSKKLGPNSSSSRLNFGGMTFKWRRDSKGGGSTKQPHSLGSNDGNKVDRTWSHSAGASPRDNSHSISMAKSLTDLPLQRNSLQESPMPATRSMSSSSQTNEDTMSLPGCLDSPSPAPVPPRHTSPPPLLPGRGGSPRVHRRVARQCDASVALNVIPPTPDQTVSRPKSDTFSFDRPRAGHKKSAPVLHSNGVASNSHSPVRRCASWAPATHGFHQWDESSLPGFAKDNGRTADSLAEETTSIPNGHVPLDNKRRKDANVKAPRTSSPLAKGSSRFSRLDLKRLLSSPASLKKTAAARSTTPLSSPNVEQCDLCTSPLSSKSSITSPSEEQFPVYQAYTAMKQKGNGESTPITNLRRLSASPKTKRSALKRHAAEDECERERSVSPMRHPMPRSVSAFENLGAPMFSPRRSPSPCDSVASDCNLSPEMPRRSKSDASQKHPLKTIKKAHFLSADGRSNSIRRPSYTLMRSSSDNNLAKQLAEKDAKAKETADGRTLARRPATQKHHFPTNELMPSQARTNKKLAKLLGAEDSGLDASRHSGSEQDLHVPSGKPSKLHHRSLTEQLEMFSVYGISRDDTKSSSGQARSDFWLPSTWTGLTDNIKSLSKRNIDEQEAIWELLTTAVTHTERLWTLANVFRETLVILQEKGFLTQVKLDRLFLNISVLKEIDETYWKDQLSLVFKEAKHKGHLLKASMVAEFFDGFAERFAPYVEFCGNQPRLMKYLAVLKKEDSDFMSYLNWCESHPTCNRLQLTDMLAAPFQRLTKYPLLLKAIMKKTNDESAKEALQGHLQVVEKFLGKVNHHVSVCQRRALLQAVADRLEDNFVEVPPEYEQYVGTGLNLQDRMWTTDGMDLGERELLHEDTFKMKEFAGKYNLELKLDVLIFVFSDMLLITKQKGGGRLQLVKPPLMIYTISLTRAKDHNNILYVVQIHTVGMATGFLVLQAATPQSASGFSKAVSEAQFAYRSQVNKGHAQAAQGKGSGKSKAHTRTFSRRLVKIPGSIYKNKRRSSKSADVKLHLDSGADETSELSDGQSGDRDVHFEEGSATTSESGTPSSDMETRSFVDPPLEEVEEEEHEIARSKSTGDVVDRLCGLEAPGAVPPQSVNKGPETVNCQLTISFCDEAGEEKPVEQDT